MDEECIIKRTPEEEQNVSACEHKFNVDKRCETDEESFITEAIENVGAKEKTEEDRMEDDSSALADTLDTELLTDLPLEVIVHILDYLPHGDKYNASVTCHILHEAFNHPMLWRKQELLLVSDFSKLTSKRNIYCMPEKSKHLIAKFGKYFQFLKIKVIGQLTDLKEWTPVLLELGKQCRLEKLVLDVGKMTTAFDQRGKPPPKQDLVALLSFIENAFRMKSLDVKSWPLFPQTMLNEDQNIFKALIRNKKLKELEHLDLFWPYKSQMWSERMPVLPDTSVVLELVQHLTSLQILGVRSAMLSNEIIEEFSNSQRSNKLSHLKIFVTYNKHRSEFQVPSIRNSLWKKFSDANPDVHVECHIMSRVPQIELSSMLKLDCPLSKIVFLQWAFLDSQIIESISGMYNKSLKTFECYCDVTEVDDALIKMVEECKCLENLDIETPTSYSINYTTVVKLASLRGKAWKKFKIKHWNISFKERHDNIDEDIVIAKNETGEYVMVGLQRYYEESHNSNTCHGFYEKISNIIGSHF